MTIISCLYPEYNHDAFQYKIMLKISITPNYLTAEAEWSSIISFTLRAGLKKIGIFQ